MARASVADTIFTNGNVVTVDDAFTIVDSFAIASDRFIAVGQSRALQEFIGPDTRVIDLEGRTVLPGFIDCHPHAILRGMQKIVEPSLVGLDPIAAIRERIAAAASKKAPGEWIVTTPIGVPPDYFNLPNGLAEKRWPTRHDLDTAAPDNPVYIPTSAYWPHPTILNSRALALLEVTRDTRDTDRVVIEKDPDSGEPTGVIRGFVFYNSSYPAFRKIITMLPAPAEEAVLEGIEKALQDEIRVGVTTLYEAHFNLQIPLMQQLMATGRLPCRVVNALEIPAQLSIDEIDAWITKNAGAAGSGSGDNTFKIIGATVSLDGPTQFGLALMDKPYLNPFGQMTNGASAVSEEKLAEIARLAARHNFRLNIQAAGSEACRMTVAALEAVNREISIKGRGWIIQHFQHPSRSDIAKLKDLGVSIQTYAAADFSKGIETYVDRFPGRDVWKTVVPYRWLLDEGLIVAGSTDGAHYDPMFQIWETLARVDGRTGKSLLTLAKTVSREEAIRLHTINGARLLQWDSDLGSIEPGKLADFVVLDRDILTIPVEQIRETQTLVTAVGGKILHEHKRLRLTSSSRSKPS